MARSEKVFMLIGSLFLLHVHGMASVHSGEMTGYIPAKQFEQSNRIAKIVYLGHSGWAVETRECILIFDYWEDSKNPASRSISKGLINAQALSNQKIFVFVSHNHRDHFDRVIFEWLYNIKDIKYVMGWPYSKAENIIGFKPRERT